MNPVRVTPPTQLPISVFDVKSRLRISHNDQDADISNMVAEAVSKMDGYRGILGRPIMPQTWRETFETWGDLRLALPDVTTATVTYVDADDAEQTVADTELKSDACGFYVVADGPVGVPITVTYGCQAPEDILPSIRRAICLHVAMSYDDPDASRFDDFDRAFHAQVSHFRWMGV